MMSAIRLDPATSAEFFEANKDAIIVLIFDAEFSGQKDLVDQIVKLLQDSNELKDKIIIGLVDVETNNELATKYSIQSVPMIACVSQDKVLKKIDALDAKRVEVIIREILNIMDLTMSLKGDEKCVDTKSVFKEYLKKLTTRAPVMIFMKGEPKQPRCGFSKQLVEILSKHNISYESFDILQDEDVRQGLKEYSDWPTYPQIYVKGEFIGGLDILKQLEQSNELESTMKV